MFKLFLILGLFLMAPLAIMVVTGGVDLSIIRPDFDGVTAILEEATTAPAQ